MADDENLTRKSWARDDQVSVQAKPDFWGWYIQEDLSTQALVCLGTSETFRFTSTYGGCCPEASTTTCSFATACTNSVIRYRGGDSGTCNDGYECVTISIVHPGQEASPTMQFVCGNTVAMSYTQIWRQLPAETTTSEVPSTSSSPSSPTASETSPTTGEPLPSNTEGTENGNTSGSSMAWIAGAVVGPLVLIVALVLGIWWYRRRSAKKVAAAQAGAQGYVPAMATHPGWAASPSYPQQPKPPSPYYQDAHGNPQWVDNGYPVAEMPSNPAQHPQELPASPPRQ